MSSMKLHGITLHRGITPGTIGLDEHGGYGEAWTREFDHARRFARPPQGYVLEAILPPSARQLILTTEPDTEGFTDYVAEGTKILAEIVGYPWLSKSLLSGWICLWETWNEEWTEAVIKAGYDSIFTSGFEGPEEYVLNPKLLQFTRYHRVLPDGKTKAYPIEPGTLEQLGYVVGLRTASLMVHLKKWPDGR
mgnify:FL=1